MSHTHEHAGVCHCGDGEGQCNCHEAPTVGERVRPYTRLIITIFVVLVFGIVLSLMMGFSWLSVMEYWMGGYFVAFGVQQALSLKKSAAMFRRYDPLAMQVAAYSYALPFIQIGLGLAYFYMVWWHVVGVAALTILLINIVGVDRVMRQKKVVRCGCLGEGMNVPVGRVTLWENLIMIGMVVMMLTYHALSYAVLGGGDTTSMPGMQM